MKSFQNIAVSLLAFALTAHVAVVQKWSLQEFCWCVWLAGLFYSWTCVVTAVIQIMLTSGSNKQYYDAKLPFVKSVSPAVFVPAIIPVSLLVGFIALYAYSWLFSFYGLFLSVFAAMQPLTLFGPNGFINSDFFTPVTYLADKYWPMIAATLFATAGDFLRNDPWERLVLPFKYKEILRIHVMVLVMPFLMLLTWALFKDDYQPLTIVLLIGIFFLIPRRQLKGKNGGSDASNQ